MDGFDVININYRGLAGAKLTTPKMYCAASIDDIAEPLQSIYERFCKGHDQKSFVLGFSMGASILTNALGKLDSKNGHAMFDGACIIQAPFRVKISYKTLEKSCGGLYNFFLSNKFSSLLLGHEYALKDKVQKLCDFDLR